MNNAKRIDEFLKYWAKIAIQNPNYNLDNDNAYNAIYSDLVRMDVSEYDKSVSLTCDGDPFNNPTDREKYKETTFYKWIKYYKDDNRIDVFNSEYWPYFCQFISTDYKATKTKEHIKIYIPLDADHIEQGTEMIFNFLAGNNISHNSKVGKHIRFDDIVVRLNNERDAIKLINYVNNNPYLQRGLIKPNPFAHQEGSVAMACDGSESYNYTVATIIGIYLNECKKTNHLQNVSYQDFYHFLSTYYKKQFINKENTILANKLRFYNNKEKREDYKEIISLILKVQNPSFQLQDYLSHYEHSYHNKMTDEDKLLIQAILKMDEKRGEGQGVNYVKAYLATGESAYLTRDDKLRENVVNSNMREIIKNRLRDNKISFEHYVNNLDPNIVINQANKK